jgi:TonB family protein
MFSLSTLGLAYTSLCAVTAPRYERAAPTQDSAPKPSPAVMIELLTPTEGADFNSYMHNIYLTTRKRWLANLPPSVKSGERGKNVVQFRILRDGTVPKETCVIADSSKHDDLDEASLSAIRGAAPFGKLPDGFTADYIELRVGFSYNVGPPQR